MFPPLLRWRLAAGLWPHTSACPTVATPRATAGLNGFTELRPRLPNFGQFIGRRAGQSAGGPARNQHVYQLPSSPIHIELSTITYLMIKYPTSFAIYRIQKSPCNSLREFLQWKETHWSRPKENAGLRPLHQRASTTTSRHRLRRVAIASDSR